MQTHTSTDTANWHMHGSVPGSVQSKVWSPKMLTGSAGEVKHSYHCPWLSEMKPCDSARASPSPQPGRFSGTSNNPSSFGRWANSMTVWPTQEMSMFGHMRIHQWRGFSVNWNRWSGFLCRYPRCYHLEVQEGKRIAVTPAPALIVAL